MMTRPKCQKKFLDSVKRSTQLVIDNHYCIKLPLKDKDMEMPENISAAEQHLTSLKKKLHRNPDFHKKYKGFMRDLQEKG